MREYDFDAAWDDTSIMYYGENESIREGVAKVLLKLPEEIREYVLDECFFFSAGKDELGTVWPSSMRGEACQVDYTSIREYKG